jgi:ankyrin repeat protein
MGYTPLHYAAYNGDTATAASLLAEDRELVHATDQVRPSHFDHEGVGAFSCLKSNRHRVSNIQQF